MLNQISLPLFLFSFFLLFHLSVHPALLAVQHMGRTAASYAEVKRQLDQLDNRKSALIEAPLKKLENLPVISSATDIAGLRNLHLSIESHVYALEKLGKKSDSYEILLGRRIMRSMSPVMREKYAHDATKSSMTTRKSWPEIRRWLTQWES